MQKNVFDTIMYRVYQEQILNVHDVKELDNSVKGYFVELEINNGKWKHVDYKDHKRINPSWLPILEKMRKMTLAYIHPKSVYFNNIELRNAINKSLGYFVNHKPLPYCDNWFMQGITRPQKLALSLINMGFGKEKLDSTVYRDVMAVICIDTAMTSNGRNNPMHKYNFGANKTEIAMGWMYISALLQDYAMLATAVREVYAPIVQTTGEGIQHDLSYDMHYGYLYNGAYGTVFMQSVIKAMNYIRDTDYALDEERMMLFRTFLLESVFGVMRGQWIDWNVLGRGISRIGATKTNFSNILLDLKKNDPAGAQDYDMVRKRIIGDTSNSFGLRAKHRFFWTTDFTVHTRPDYYFSIHAVSKRNHAQEIGNMENLQGYWGAQGTTNLMINGDEHANLFPLWDWGRLPGTTLPDTVPILSNKAPGEGDRWGTSAFSGGVSDSLYGVTAYVVNQDLETSAKKSWFMFDKEIVCLGSGVQSTLPQKIATTVNQVIFTPKNCFVKRKGKKAVVVTKEYSDFFKDLEWVIHDRVGYFFAQESNNTALTIENRRGDWSSVRGGGNYEKFESKDVFQLTIEHGIKPRTESYAYTIVPGIQSREEMEYYVKQDNYIVRNNDHNIQAVYHKKLKIWQLVFYKELVKYEDEMFMVWTDIPAILMIKENPMKKHNLYITDPTQQHDKVTVFIARKGEKTIEQLVLNFSKKPYRGQTVSTVF